MSSIKGICVYVDSSSSKDSLYSSSSKSRLLDTIERIIDSFFIVIDPAVADTGSVYYSQKNSENTPWKNYNHNVKKYLNYASRDHTQEFFFILYIVVETVIFHYKNQHSANIKCHIYSK